MIEQTQTNKETNWAVFSHKHKIAFTVFITTMILAAIGAVYVFVWFTGNAQSTNLIPATLNLWSMNDVLIFILHTVFLELVIIGTPLAICAVIAWQWWKRLPDKSEYTFSEKRSKSNRVGKAIGPLLHIAFAIKIYVDGNWNSAIASWTLNYVIGSMVTILIWTVAIFAIAAIIGIVWWTTQKHNKK